MLNKFLTKPFLSDQILYDELKELQWSDYLSNSRPRHEQLEIVDKCGKSHIKSCCDELYFQVLKDKMKYIRRECYRQIRHNHTFTPINPLSCESITRYREDVTVNIFAMVSFLLLLCIHPLEISKLESLKYGLDNRCHFKYMFLKKLNKRKNSIILLGQDYFCMITSRYIIEREYLKP